MSPFIVPVPACGQKPRDGVDIAQGNPAYNTIMNFIGVEATLLMDDKLLLIQRDNKPGLRFAGLWDFPGGGRENDKSPFECATREVREELNIKLYPGAVVWQKTYPAMNNPTLHAYFMVIKLSGNDVTSIKFGNEGQGWKFMSIDDFMQSDEVVAPLKGRLSDYLKNK